MFDRDRPSYRAYLRTLAGKEIEYIVREKRRPRTLNFNAYLHAVALPLMAEYMGQSIEETKLDLMGECWGWRTVRGRKVPAKPRTSKMTQAESKFLLDWMIPWAAQLPTPVIIPLPGEAEP